MTWFMAGGRPMDSKFVEPIRVVPEGADASMVDDVDLPPKQSVASQPPISAELWLQLKRFDPQCEIALVRTSPKSGSPWIKYRRVWVATIRPMARTVVEHVQVDHPKLAEAVRLVIEAAEHKGWHRSPRQ